MTFEKLIEKLEKIPDQGVDAILKNTLQNFKNEKDRGDFHLIEGILWGLYATKFINDNERKELSNYILNIYMQDIV